MKFQVSSLFPADSPSPDKAPGFHIFPHRRNTHQRNCYSTVCRRWHQRGRGLMHMIGCKTRNQRFRWLQRLLHGHPVLTSLTWGLLQRRAAILSCGRGRRLGRAHAKLAAALTQRVDSTAYGCRGTRIGAGSQPSARLSRTGRTRRYKSRSTDVVNTQMVRASGIRQFPSVGQDFTGRSAPH